MSSKTDAQRAIEVIRAYPLASLLGAVAAGFLAARLVVRNER